MSIEYVSPKIASHLRSLARDVAYTEGHASVMRAAADRIEALEAERGHFKRFWHDSEAECRGVRERLDEARTRIEALEARLERATGDSMEQVIHQAMLRARQTRGMKDARPAAVLAAIRAVAADAPPNDLPTQEVAADEQEAGR